MNLYDNYNIKYENLDISSIYIISKQYDVYLKELFMITLSAFLILFKNLNHNARFSIITISIFNFILVINYLSFLK